MFWQKSYRLEWYLIIWHYLNLYVYSISFIARHFLLWKLTGAKFNFESMFQQERNPNMTNSICWISGNFRMGFIFAQFATSMKSPKIDTTKRLPDSPLHSKIHVGLVKKEYTFLESFPKKIPDIQCTYCKRGYFRWGKISRKCSQDLSRGGYFRDSFHISLIKSYGFYFRVGEIFAKKTISRKTRKLPPRENFHVYSIQYTTERIWQLIHAITHST